mmetsp:Transcript_41059/g.102098  ORF Transcript_41059/g.102098 Transcript_41059/m.102098 type:complete len:256 (-) Transcript_41059:192-959(-)
MQRSRALSEHRGDVGRYGGASRRGEGQVDRGLQLLRQEARGDAGARQGVPRCESSRDAPQAAAGRAARGVRSPGDAPHGVLAARLTRLRLDVQARRRLRHVAACTRGCRGGHRQDSGADPHPLGGAAGHVRRAQVGDALADRSELRCLRLGAHRGADGGALFDRAAAAHDEWRLLVHQRRTVQNPSRPLGRCRRAVGFTRQGEMSDTCLSCADVVLGGSHLPASYSIGDGNVHVHRGAVCSSLSEYRRSLRPWSW